MCGSSQSKIDDNGPVIISKRVNPIPYKGQNKISMERRRISQECPASIQCSPRAESKNPL